MKVIVHLLQNTINTTYECLYLQDILMTFWCTESDREIIRKWYHSDSTELYVSDYKLVKEFAS